MPDVSEIDNEQVQNIDNWEYLLHPLNGAWECVKLSG
jgi:hypothetical protein